MPFVTYTIFLGLIQVVHLFMGQNTINSDYLYINVHDSGLINTLAISMCHSSRDLNFFIFFFHQHIASVIFAMISCFYQNVEKNGIDKKVMTV